ncbi:hypothetical protein [Erythrobacter sp. THAF29]|uniref:hypothetical protein n=1 Tax=Erythrobacter sp. THAF29 TaxID=2587851 RepID=UPI0012A80429|nr:hypothetical protein [Erythrobacter sp. THAF29]QFT77836.1 hypothetical protein FIU90_09845 [Erythrobacter sp. THAF29]
MEPAILLLLLVAVTLFFVSKRYEDQRLRLIIKGTAIVAATGALTSAGILLTK